ncbi:MAG: hypothetical protein MJ202_07110 [Lentisphaeria bacterium]|nr:hypothetical protein [Lentisphaeria bacterium]
MKKRFSSIVLLCAAALLSAADSIRLASLWTDHAVVQRDKPIVVWGWCDEPRTIITASIGESRATGATAWDGRFELRLPALPAGGPYELKVSTANGASECIRKDILVGEVWLVSGQSNAQYPLKSLDFSDPLSQLPQFLKEGGEDPMLRCYTVPHDALAAIGDTISPNPGWQLSECGTAGRFTAIGAWFAFYFRKQFPEIPIGIIHASWGGTSVVTWCSRSVLAETPAGRRLLAIFDQKTASETTWGALNPPFMEIVGERLGSLDYATVTEKDRGNTGFALGYASPDFDDTEWKSISVPGSWIVQKLADFGAVWYRKAINVPESWAGQPVEVRLGGVDKHDVTYFNGVQVGATGKDFETQYWDVLRKYDVEGSLVKAGKNTIAIRVFSFCSDGGFTGIAPFYSLRNTATGEEISLAGDDWKACAEYSFAVKQATPKYTRTTFAGDCNAPHRLFDNKIRPLIPYGIRGVLWYQGESDTHTDDQLDNYLQRFTAMIRDWRYQWAQGEDFPFYFVQLANFQDKGTTYMPANWLRIQNMQRQAALMVPNTGVVTASDLALSEPNEIHPHDKRSVGYRLFQLAFGNVYGGNVIPQGPMMDTMAADGATLRVHFRYGEGLHVDSDGPIRGFDIAGEDGNYVPATAVISGDEVILSADGIDHPVSCRYNANTGLPEGHLLNAANLPALSFFESL